MKIKSLFQSNFLTSLFSLLCFGLVSLNPSVNAQTNSSTQSVVGFTLVNADNATDIRQINNGAVLNLATLATKNLSIRANTNPTTVGSVTLDLSGAASIKRTENFLPYALTHNSPGSYAPWTPPLGNYILTATPYTLSYQHGTKGTPLMITFSVIDQLPPAITSGLTSIMTKGIAGGYQILASNNPTSFSANNLPAGLTINASTGLISGTPTVSGSYTVTIGASNAAGADTKQLSLTVKAQAPVITSALTASATQGKPFSYQITASNTPTSFSASGLPSGLTFSQSSGLISGTPTVNGSFSVTIGASNSGGSDSKTLSLKVVQVVTTTTGRTFYISALGSDSNDGRSEGKPWKTFNHVNAYKFLQNGDTILLKAGEKFYGPLLINGVSQIKVTRYGDGADPIIYGDHSNAKWTAVAAYAGLYSAPVNLQTDAAAKSKSLFDASNHYTIVAPIATGSSMGQWLTTIAEGKWGFSMGSSSGGDEMVYMHTIGNGAPNSVHIYDEIIMINSTSSNVVLDHLDLRNGKHAVMTSADKTVVQYCHIQDTMANGIIALNASHCEIHDNTLLRIGDTSIYLFKESYDWVHHNKTSYTVDTILGLPNVGGSGERCGIGMQQGHNNVVEYNDIDHTMGSFFDFYYETKTEVRYNLGFHSGAGAFPHGTGLSFHHNILDTDGGWSGLELVYAYDSTKSTAANYGKNIAFNNIVMNFKGYGLLSAGKTSKMSVFRNNIVKSIYASTPVSCDTSADLDYNCFHMPNSTRGYHVAGVNYTTFKSYQAAKEIHGIYGNPNLGSNYIPATTSICIDKGLNLKNAGLTILDYEDFNGAVSPMGASTDIGPFEVK